MVVDVVVVEEADPDGTQTNCCALWSGACIETDSIQKVLTSPAQTGQGFDGTSSALAVEVGINIRAITVSGITYRTKRLTN
jgi:hypothetical protein